MKKIFVAIALVASFASAQPVWSDVLSTAGISNQTSGTAWKIGPSPQPIQAQNASLESIGNILALSVSTLNGTGNQGGSINCGPVGSPMSFIESNQIVGIKGVGFLGSFNAPRGGLQLTYLANQGLFKAVFFHEDYCYGSTQGSTSREYGFFLAGSNSSIWVYWGTKENQAGQVQAQLELSGIYSNTQYYFSMYPTGNADSCGFEVYILTQDLAYAYPLTYIPVNSYNNGGIITTADPGFCADVTGAPSGYISANIVAQPAVSGTVPAGVGVGLSRVYVGR